MDVTVTVEVGVVTVTRVVEVPPLPESEPPELEPPAAPAPPPIVLLAMLPLRFHISFRHCAMEISSRTSTVLGAVCNDGSDISGTTSLCGTVVEAVAKVGVLAKAGNIGAGASQAGSLLEHVVQAHALG